MEPHPFALEYPRATDAEAAIIEADMREFGYDSRFPIIIYNGMLLDGLTRNGIALKLGIAPVTETFEGTEDEARAFVARANENRRHLTAAWLKKKRADRAERIAKARDDGATIAEIAEAEGVNESTVKRDLELSNSTGAENDACPGKPDDAAITYEEPPAATGIDETKKPEKPLCSHCARMKRTNQPAVRGCQECKKLRGAAKLKADEPELEEDKPEPTIEDAMKAKNSEIESFARKLAAMIDDMPTDAWLDKDNRKGSVTQKIKDACATLRSCKCSNICPMCTGDGCRHCEKTGRVPKYTYQQLVS